MVLPDRALAIKTQWLDLILAGTKTIEIRGCNHNFAGQAIYLLETRTGLVRGTARLSAARELSAAEVEDNRAGLDAMAYRRPRAWPLTEVVTLATPWQMSGQARSSCQTWVPRQRWERFPVLGAEQATTTPRREEVVSGLLQRRRPRRARRPSLPVEDASAGDDAKGVPGAASSSGLARASRESGKSPVRLVTAAAAAEAAEGQDRSAATAEAAGELPAASPGTGKRSPRAVAEAVAAKRARKRSGPKARFVLRAEDEEEDVEENEDAVYAEWGRDHLMAVLETLDAAVTTGADEQLRLNITELQALVEGIPASVLRLANLESIPETLKQMNSMPRGEMVMEVLGALRRVSAAAANRRDRPASTAEEVPATIPDAEAVGKLLIRRLTSIGSMSETNPSDEGFDIWEEDTISDVVERVFATLGLEGTPADFNFRQVVVVKEGDATTSRMIPVEGTVKAVEAKDVVICKKGG